MSRFPLQPRKASQQFVHVQDQESLTASTSAFVSEQEQKEIIGERLYPLVQTTLLSLAGKITGMLLETDNPVILHMLEHEESLKTKMEEAIIVLQTYQKGKLFKKY